MLFLIFITTVYPSTDNMTCSDILIITWHVIMLPAEWVQPGTNVYLTESLMSVYELVFTPTKILCSFAYCVEMTKTYYRVNTSKL